MGYFGNEEVYKQVTGATVAAVEVHEGVPSLVLADGRRLMLPLKGDCCSSSYYTDLKQFYELVGATIQSIEEREGKSVDTLNDADADGYTCDGVSWHFLVITTDRGHVTVDWRNDSNGYYDGSVCPVLN